MWTEALGETGVMAATERTIRYVRRSQHWTRWGGWLLLLLRVIAGCGTPAQPRLPLNDERVVIFQAILAAKPLTSHPTKMVAETLTSESCFPDTIIEHLPSIPPTLVTDWCLTNQTRMLHDPALIATLGLTTDRNTPGGIFASSAIQFDATHTQALVRVDYAGVDFVDGYFVWLTNQQGIWTITRQWHASMS